jgi:hypothetical protein
VLVLGVSAERERRKNELHRVEGLDKKISLELQSLKEKVSAMTAEMNSFKSTEQLTKESEDAKKLLLVTKQKLIKQREAIKQQVAQLSAQQKKRDVVCTLPPSLSLFPSHHSLCVYVCVCVSTTAGVDGV